MKTLRYLLPLLLVAGSAFGQSSPNWQQGYVPPPAEWNSLWAGKANTNNGTLNNATFSGTANFGSATVSGLPAPTNCANCAITGGSIVGTSIAATALSTTIGGNSVTLTPSAQATLQFNNGVLGQIGSLGVGNINLTQLTNPVAPTITNAGTSGSTSDTYAIIAVMADGTTSGLGVTTATTTANATLSSSNYNTITWTTVTGAFQYQVWRTAAGGNSSTTGLIATVSAGVTSYNDQGAAGNSAVAPTYNGTAVFSLNGIPAIQFGNAWRGVGFSPDPEDTCVGVGACGGLNNPGAVEIAAFGYEACGGAGSGTMAAGAFDNSCFGYFSLGNLTTGHNNAAGGNASMGNETVGSANAIFGGDAARHPVGANNTAGIGYGVFYNTTCQNSIGVGYSAVGGGVGSSNPLATCNQVVVVTPNGLNSTSLVNPTIIATTGPNILTANTITSPNNLALFGTSILGGTGIVAPTFNALLGNNILNSNSLVSPFNNAIVGDNIGASASGNVSGLAILGHSAASAVTTDTNILAAGVFAGRHLAGSQKVTILGPNVASTTCVNPNSVLIIGTDTNTDCTTAAEVDTIHMGAGGADIMYVTGTNTPATSVLTLSSGTIKFSNAFAANGTTSVSLTAVAPSGAHATAQEWLTLTDGGGTVRYIPVF